MSEGTGRRMFKRIPLEVKLRYLLPLETFDQVYSASTFDIGNGGIGLEVESPIMKAPTSSSSWFRGTAAEIRRRYASRGFASGAYLRGRDRGLGSCIIPVSSAITCVPAWPASLMAWTTSPSSNPNPFGRSPRLTLQTSCETGISL